MHAFEGMVVFRLERNIVVVVIIRLARETAKQTHTMDNAHCTLQCVTVEATPCSIMDLHYFTVVVSCLPTSHCASTSEASFRRSPVRPPGRFFMVDVSDYEFIMRC